MKLPLQFLLTYKDTTTGISAEERGLTARMCVTENVNPFDFRRPGHMFPLIAKDGGALERNGHTEATVDLLRLAGLKECGLCCEIMNENGKMMRTPDLIQFSQTHHIPTLTIKELQEYRKIMRNAESIEYQIQKLQSQINKVTQ